MKAVLKSPYFNAVCICLFSAFYGYIFIWHIGYRQHDWLLNYGGRVPVWLLWRAMLADGWHVGLAKAFVGVTVVVVSLLLKRPCAHDEYHTSILTDCLVAATVLVLSAIAVFCVVVLREPVWIAGKFMLFALVQWAMVVFSNLAYVLLCRWR